VVRAFGKVILFGEHAVVYGCPALAAGLELGAEASAEPASEARVSVQPWGVSVTPEPLRASAPDKKPGEPSPEGSLAQAFAALLAGYDPPPSAHVRVTLHVPSGAGLGGSAALSVAIVRALDGLLGRERSPSELSEHALAAERVFHGNPSGVDRAMAAHGGVALYKKGAPLTKLALKAPFDLVVGHSGEPGMTKETVASVARQHQARPEKTQKIFAGIEAIVQNGKSALERGDLDALGQLMELNQKLLVSLMVSTSTLEAMCTAAVKAGALGAKLTGGGGGGCMIALAASHAQALQVQHALEAEGYRAFVTRVSD
jgi:mevalonate kinase